MARTRNAAKREREMESKEDAPDRLAKRLKDAEKRLERLVRDVGDHRTHFEQFRYINKLDEETRRDTIRSLYKRLDQVVEGLGRIEKNTAKQHDSLQAEIFGALRGVVERVERLESARRGTTELSQPLCGSCDSGWLD